MCSTGAQINGVLLLSKEKEGTADTSNTVAGTQKHCIERKKQTQKEHVLCEPIYIKS